MVYKIIGVMTGNSNDAMDLVLTEFTGDGMRDVAGCSVPYTPDFQKQMNLLRNQVCHQKKADILALPLFQEVHQIYITLLARAVLDFLKQEKLTPKEIDAIGFHGKTLDHYPPSQAKKNGDTPYTLQMGSGQKLADLTGIPVVYDFRSDPVQAGLEGAPLIPLHNLHIAATEGEGCYFNGGNTANFTWIQEGKILAASDTGPFNAYVDAFVQNAGQGGFDKDGALGKKGTVQTRLLPDLFGADKSFYTAPVPKSGDPQYYHQDKVFRILQKVKFHDAVRTLEYLAAYTAFYGLTFMPGKGPLAGHFHLFGGGWKNPLVKKDFAGFLTGKNAPLPGHEQTVNSFLSRLQDVKVSYSELGTFMEARLMADMAYFFLEKKPWTFGDGAGREKQIICGRCAHPGQKSENDAVNRAAKGWQESL